MSLKMKKIIFWYKMLFLVAALHSCNNKNDNLGDENKDAIYNFDISQWDINKKISNSIIKEIDFIPLETNPLCLISNIRKIIPYNGKFYILDSNRLNGILIFDAKGKYLKKIGEVGRGSGEFLSLNDFVIDSNNEQALILDSQLKKVIKFDLKTGEFQGEIKLDFWASNMLKLQDNSLAFFLKNEKSSELSDFSIKVINIKNNTNLNLLEKDEYDTNISYPICFFQSIKSLYAPFLKETVYFFKKNNVIQPYIHFNFGDYKIPEDELRKSRKLGLAATQKLLYGGKWIFGAENIFENDEYLTFNIVNKGVHTHAIYSKKSANLDYGLCYDGEYAILGLIKNIAVKEKYFIGFVSAQGITYFKKQMNLKNQSKIYSNLDSVTINSNPILTLISYK